MLDVGMSTAADTLVGLIESGTGRVIGTVIAGESRFDAGTASVGDGS